MKKIHRLALEGIFLSFALTASVALASVSLPPINPTVEPPGPSISYEQIRRMKICEETYHRARERCTYLIVGDRAAVTFTDTECIKRAQREYQGCIEGILNPPQLILPNGNSPGQGN